MKGGVLISIFCPTLGAYEGGGGAKSRHYSTARHPLWMNVFSVALKLKVLQKVQA